MNHPCVFFSGRLNTSDKPLYICWQLPEMMGKESGGAERRPPIPPENEVDLSKGFLGLEGPGS